MLSSDNGIWKTVYMKILGDGPCLIRIYEVVNNSITMIMVPTKILHLESDSENVSFQSFAQTAELSEVHSRMNRDQILSILCNATLLYACRASLTEAQCSNFF